MATRILYCDSSLTGHLNEAGCVVLEKVGDATVVAAEQIIGESPMIEFDLLPCFVTTRQINVRLQPCHSGSIAP